MILQAIYLLPKSWNTLLFTGTTSLLILPLKLGLVCITMNLRITSYQGSALQILRTTSMKRDVCLENEPLKSVRTFAGFQPFKRPARTRSDTFDHVIIEVAREIRHLQKFLCQFHLSSQLRRFTGCTDLAEIKYALWVGYRTKRQVMR